MILDPPLALLLGVAGGALQFFVRQFETLPDWVYHALAVIVGFSIYILVTPDWTAGEWRDVVTRSIVWLAERVPVIWGGTFVTSNAAKAVALRHPGSSSSLFVPQTSSK